MAEKQRRSTRPRLAFGAFFWRLFLLLSISVELGRAIVVSRLGAPVGQRIAFFLFASPAWLCSTFFTATIVTVLADLWVRMVIRPFSNRWHHPTVDASSSNFHLDVRETVVAETPARRRDGRSWPTGTLIRTDRRVWFFPQSWDTEPWSAPLVSLDSVALIAAPRMFLGFVRDLPPRLLVTTKDQESLIFVVPEPFEAAEAFSPSNPGLVNWIA